MTTLYIAFVIFIISAINVTYYYTTKKALVSEQEEKISTIVNSMTTAIQNSSTGEQLFEDMIGLNLRTASVATQYALPADVEKVENEKLTEIKNKLLIDGITLLKKQGDDIVGYRSTDPKEIGMSTKSWTQGWFPAFNQLLDNHDAKKGDLIKYGQFLPHYWSGPFDTSSTNTKNIDKWGYYNDGGTNYLIDPYVHDTHLLNFRKATGVDATISQLVEKNKWLIEIGVIKHQLDEQKQEVPMDPNWYQQREVQFGKYSYPDVVTASTNFDFNDLQRGKKVNTFIKVEGKDIMRTYISLKNLVQGPYNAELLLCIVTDYQTIIDTLFKQQLNLLLIILSVTIISLFVFVITLRMLNRSKEEAVLNAQGIYTGNIDALFNSIKEQRHDFTNHVNTIHSLIELGKLEELKTYAKEIIGETIETNDIIKIDNPALCALVQAKAAQAVNRKIAFEHELSTMEELGNSAIKSTEVVKIISNLLDNAFEATTMDNSSNEKRVKIKGAIHDGLLNINVTNTGNPIPDEIVDIIFKSGFSTKEGGKNRGLGLAIVTKLIKKYQGTISVSHENGENRFAMQLVL
ncbi:ATP-binding protein [Paenibacillus sp. LjRoot153]|uniref:sensor histidine kinase n=1 Tax=Paenibacillus sp. LjRoot153 TaxID=3342270 RepID=UPI003ECE70E8